MWTLILPLYILSLLFLFLYLFFKFIYTPHKANTTNLDITGYLSILNAIIITQLEIYEKNVFDTRGAITNSNYDNYYNDITHSIVESLSPDFYYKLSFYITEEAIVTIIARTVMDYLKNKVNGAI